MTTFHDIKCFELTPLNPCVWNNENSGVLLEVEENDGLEVSTFTDEFKMHVGFPETLHLPKANATFQTPFKFEEDSCGISRSSLRRELQAIRAGAKKATVYIDDYKTTSFQSLLQTLTKCNMLRVLKIERLREKSNKRVRDLTEMVQLFAAVRSLPKLKELRLCNFNFDDLVLITSFVDEHPTLTSLQLHLMSKTVDQALLDALAKAPKLKRLSLNVQKSFSLSTLLSSKTLNHVSVPSENFQFKEKHLLKAIKTLQVNSTLCVLDLKPRLSASDLRAIMFGLETNKKLEIFRFSFLALEKEAGIVLTDLCQSLTKNSGLRVLKNHYAKVVKVGDSDKARMIDLLRLNYTLDELTFYDEDNDPNDATEQIVDCTPNWACFGHGAASFFPSKKSSTVNWKRSFKDQPMVTQLQDRLADTWLQWLSQGQT